MPGSREERGAGTCAKAVRGASEAAAAAEDDLPLEDSGNLPAFLATARKAAYDTYATTPQERAIVDEEYAAITTRGEAKAFVARVMAKATLVRDSQPCPAM